MKQIDECLTRAFAGQPPLRKKWKAVIHYKKDAPLLCLFHYQHPILVFDLSTKRVLYEWHEKPADKRGLDAAKDALLAGTYDFQPFSKK